VANHSNRGDAVAGSSDGPEGGWELWRQDDNGNRFRIARFGTQSEAGAEQQRFESLGHKQTYWVQPAKARSGG
jgi:hypothetical protein